MTLAHRRSRPRVGARTSLTDLLPAVFRRILAVVVVIALVTGGVLAFMVSTLWPASTRLSRGDRALTASFQAMLDEETGIRAYLATGNTTFLAPYTSAAAAVNGLNASMVENLSGIDQLAPLVVRVQVVSAQWTTGWVAVAIDGPTARPDEKVALDAFLARGKQLFDNYRDAHAALRNEVTRRLDAIETTRRVLLAAVLVGDLLLAVVLTGLVVREFGRIRRTVIEPVGELRDAVAAIRAGNLPLPAHADAVDELRELSAGVVSLGESLLIERGRVRERDATAVRQSGHLKQILSMAREIGGSLNMRYVVESVADAARALGPYGRVQLWLLAEDEHSLRLSHDTAVGHSRPSDRTVSLGEGLLGRAAKFGRVTTAVDVEPDVAGESVPPGAFAIPLVVGARVIGVLEIHPTGEAAVPDSDMETLEALCVQAAVAIEASRLYSLANDMAQVDPLTRLLNRRRLDEDLHVEVERALRYGRPISVAMIDLDHFKRINDTAGHQRADEILQEISALLQETVRSDDTVYRYGGEELFVLARESTPEDAGALAERLRAAIEARFTTGGSIGVTASFGIAGFPVDATSEHSLIAQADRALYEAKRLGRNRVVCASQLHAVESPAE